MENLLGVNTVRLPVDTHTVGSSWWNAYRGTIDAATGRGFKVILAYWEDGAASGGRITNMAAFNSMWDTVVAQYGGNDLVHFEPMNEPHGYSASEWLNVAAGWINARPSVPKGRILVGGTGFSQDLRPVCDDSRFTGTLLSFHFYAFFYGQHDYAGWRDLARTRLGNCASRVVVTEFGAPMDTGLDYGNQNSADNFVRYLRAVTDTMRDKAMGGTYWPALGGKVTAGQSYDWYSMFALQGSGTTLSLSLRNAAGADRLRHAWGDDGGPGGQVTPSRTGTPASASTSPAPRPPTTPGPSSGRATVGPTTVAPTRHRRLPGARRPPLRPVPGRDRFLDRERHPAPAVRLPGHHQPAVEPLT